MTALEWVIVVWVIVVTSPGMMIGVLEDSGPVPELAVGVEMTPPVSVAVTGQIVV